VEGKKCMSVIKKKFVVIKHPLKLSGKTHFMGVTFMDGTSVIVKDSTLYKTILRSPILKNRKELSLDWLQKLGFKENEIRRYFGKEVFMAYIDTMNEINKAKKELVIDSIDSPIVSEMESDIPTESLCKFIKKDNQPCTNSAHPLSKTGAYCFGHLRFEKKELTELKHLDEEFYPIKPSEEE